MSRAARLSLTVAIVVVLLNALPGTIGSAQAPDALPNPYRPIEGWAKMPDGRSWGSPAAVQIDNDGRSIWVFERCGNDSCTDSPLAPILKFDASGRVVKSFGAGMFAFPHGLTQDKDGNIWVTDGRGEKGKGHQVFKFSPDGKVLLTLGKAGVAGEGPDTFNMPSDVAIASNGDIFVADGHVPLMTNNRIVKFSKDGTFIKAWGRRGSGRGELNDPHGIAFDSRGRLFVADRGNQRIQIFDQDGGFIAEWKQFGRPSGLYISKDDTLYVADADAGILIGSARDGSLSAHLEKPAGVERVAESVAVDAQGVLYAGENGNVDPPRGRLGQKLMKYVKR